MTRTTAISTSVKPFCVVFTSSAFIGLWQPYTGIFRDWCAKVRAPDIIRHSSPTAPVEAGDRKPVQVSLEPLGGPLPLDASVAEPPPQAVF